MVNLEKEYVLPFSGCRRADIGPHLPVNQVHNNLRIKKIVLFPMIAYVAI